MPYPLLITFDGLSAFLPSDEIQAGSALDWVSVFLVHTAELTDFPAHKPLLTFKLVDQEGQDATKILPETEVLWPLKEVDVFLDFTAAEPPNIRPAFGHATGEKPASGDPDEVADLFWVPRLDRALPQSEALRLGLPFHGGNLSSDCLATIPLEDRVTARIHLRKGRLRVKDHVRVNDILSVSQFIPTEETNPLRQALSAGVALDVADVDGPVRVKIRPFGSGSFQEVILGSASRTVELKIGFSNLCDCDYGVGYGTGYGADYRDRDFELYYILNGLEESHLRSLPAPAPVRFEVPLAATMGQGGTVFKRCTESQLLPLSSTQSAAFKADVVEGLEP